MVEIPTASGPPPCRTLGQQLNWCAKQRYRQYVEGCIELPQEHWAGWRITHQYLIAPGGKKFTARSLRLERSETPITDTAHGSPILKQLNICWNAANE